MDRFRELTLFVAVADRGAFNAAARDLALSPAAVTRAIATLEERLGVRLLTRTTRRLALTDAGRRLHADATRILADLAEAEASAAGSHEAPRGVLRVTAPVLFGQRYIAPIVREFLDAHPQVQASVLFVDRVVNLIDEGLDVALRIGALPDSSLSATRVGQVRLVTVAAPDYLERAGGPETPEDLVRHRLVHPTGLAPGPEWDFVKGGRRSVVGVVPALSVNTMTAAIEAACAGWGITRTLSYQVSDEIAQGTLVEILPGAENRAIPIHLVHAEGRRAAAKIRVFVDRAARTLRRDADRLAARSAPAKLS